MWRIHQNLEKTTLLHCTSTYTATDFDHKKKNIKQNPRPLAKCPKSQQQSQTAKSSDPHPLPDSRSLQLQACSLQAPPAAAGSQLQPCSPLPRWPRRQSTFLRAVWGSIYHPSLWQRDWVLVIRFICEKKHIFIGHPQKLPQKLLKNYPVNT